MQTLNIEKREAKALAKIRKDGKMPAVFYGPKEESTPIVVDQKAFRKIWKEAGESSVITLAGAQAGEGIDALIHDVDVDPVTGEPRHADFYVPERGKKITVAVPLEFTGVSTAVKELGGTLVKVLHELEVEVLPKDLPHLIEVDISPIESFDTHITIKDLALPAGVAATGNPDDVVVLVAEAKEEVEEAPADVSAIELSEKKGKAEEEGASEEGK